MVSREKNKTIKPFIVYVFFASITHTILHAYDTVDRFTDISITTSKL